MAKETKKTQLIELDKFNINQLPELQNKKEEVAAKLKEFEYIEITDNTSYEKAKKSRTGVRTIRTDLQKEQKNVDKKIKDFILNPVKEAYNSLIETVTPIEDKQQSEVTRWEDIKEEERKEKERIEEARKQKHRDNIDLFFNHNKKLIDELTFDKLPHELIYKIEDQEFTMESFEEFDDVFESKIDFLKIQLAEKANSLQEKENIRLENQRIKKEREESERKEKIKNSIDYYYNNWQDLFSKMKFEEIDFINKKFNSEKALDCQEFQEDYAQKRANLVRMLEAKSIFLTQAEEQRLAQEKLDKEKAEIEEAKKKLESEKEKLEEEKQILEEVKSKPSEEEVSPNEIDVVEEEVVESNITEEVKEETQEVEFEEKEMDLVQLLLKAKSTICSLKLSMLAHPDCTEGSEFDDYTDLAQETEDDIQAFLNQITDEPT